MKQKTLLSTIFILISIFIYAQDSVTVSGKILDNNKQPLPGATILVKGTTLGTQTDNNGKYSLTVPRDAKTLVVSYIGFNDQEMPVNGGQGNHQLNIQMSASDIALNQVVVSASRKEEKLLDAPASISVIGKDEIDRNVVTSLADELETTAGVDVMKTGLISRNVVVRGFNDIFSGTVLNVIDDRIGAVPSLQFNAFQLIPVSDLDLDKIEVVRGPASALYGPNAAGGVISYRTKSPLDQDKQIETTVSMSSGFIVLDKSYQQYNNGHPFSGNIVNPEIRNSGKFLDGKIGYKVSASYFEGQDYPNYDPREPYNGDSLLFGSVHNGNLFTPDSIRTIGYDSITRKMDTTYRQDIRLFNKNFFIKKYTADARLDFKPIKDLLITISGGLSSSHNIELTGLGAAQAGGSGGWIYWYIQTKIKWKRLFIQYFTNASNSGQTYLIPQLSQSDRVTYGSTSPPTPYPVQLLTDKSMLHVVQVQHSWQPLEKLGFIYGVDGLFTRPNTEGTINGRFEPIDKLNQVGGYIQGTYDPLKWLTFVAAIRLDYNSVVENVAVSPRAAVVFKVAENQTIRLTYNRAFDPPTTLDQFLDLAETQLPNGADARGIGNPYGYNYNYTNGNIDYISAPWGGPQSNTQWYAFNSTAGNVPMFDSLKNYMIKSFASGAGGVANATAIINTLFNGISGPNGTVANATLNAVNLNNFSSTNNYAASLISNPNFQNLKKINNSYTSTLELGYKGLLFHKLSVQVDAYWTRITNYVSALTPASAGVTFNYKSFLGNDDPSGILYQNLAANGGALNGLLGAIRNVASLQNPTVVPISPSNSPASDWSEIVTLLSTLPVGTITPNSPYVNSDYILTFENQGTINTYGGDIGLQYLAFETDRHNISLGGTFSYVDKDHYVVSPGDTAWLNAPKIKASITFDHTLKKSGFGYGLTFRYQQAYFGESSVYLGQVKNAYLPDARIYYKPKFYKGLLLSLNVNDFINYQWASFPGYSHDGDSDIYKSSGYILIG